MPSPCVGRPFGLMANATGGMPFANYPAPLRLRRSARPINPLRGGPGWIGEPTKKPARREPCGLWTCLSISCSPKPLRAVIGVLDGDAGMQTFSCEPAVAILTTVFKRSMGRARFRADPAASVLHAAVHVPHCLRAHSALGSGQHA